MQKLNSQGKIDTIIVVAMTVIVITATMALFSQPNKAKYSFNVHNAMKVIKGNLYLHMEDSNGWQETLDSANTSVSKAPFDGTNSYTANLKIQCVKDGTDCSSFESMSPSPIIDTIKDVAGEYYLYGLHKPTTGVGLDGKVCTTFDEVNGNPGCPIRVKIYWKPSCGTMAPCLNPPYIVNVEFEYKIPAGYGPTIDLSKYNFSLTKP